MILLVVPAIAWALALWTRGDASDALLHTSWLTIVAAPLAGVAAAADGRRSRRGSRAIVSGLALGAGAAVLASALVMLAALGTSALGFVLQSHAVMAAVAFALAAFGALAGTLFDDVLDAAAVSVLVAMLASGGLLFAGAWAGSAPRPVVDALLAASPFVAIASAGHVDVMRLDLFYSISPLAHLGVEYPTWYVTGAGYAIVAALCCSGVWFASRVQRRTPAV